MTDEEYLDIQRKALEESVRFFTPAMKGVRELWVVAEFLANLGTAFLPSDLVPGGDPPDVRFGDAEFEVKEILDVGRRRHAEFKAALEKAKRARSPHELLEDYTPRDITYQEVYQLVEKCVLEVSRKYAADFKKGLDLLFYVNLDDVHGYIDTPLPAPDALRATGFRSVSCVIGPLGIVLMVNDGAPAFLSENGPRIVRRSK
jgi:hypothetical protein